MTKLSTIIAGLILVVGLANAAHQPWDIRRNYDLLFRNEDSPSHFDKVLGPARSKIEMRGLSRLGYRVEPGANWEAKVGEYFLIQYSFAPVVLRAHTDEDEWVLMNYSATQKPFPAPDLSLVEDLGDGLALYRIPELGRVWHEKEGPWTGTWNRRGRSGVFDAVWTGPDGPDIHDELKFESLTGHDIVLFRKGTKGRYRGRLSDDGSKVESGQADWFSPGDSWAATVEK